MLPGENTVQLHGSPSLNQHDFLYLKIFLRLRLISTQFVVEVEVGVELGKSFLELFGTNMIKLG